jgi:hypothetical protein
VNVEDDQEEMSIGEKAAKSKISVKIRTMNNKQSRLLSSPEKKEGNVTYDFSLVNELFSVLD